MPDFTAEANVGKTEGRKRNREGGKETGNRRRVESSDGRVER